MSKLLPDENPSDNRKRAFPPKPRAYHMTEPSKERGLWCFWLTADDTLLEYVSHLYCILQPMYTSPFQRRLKGRVMFAINPRYDHEEAWLWINEMLESETSTVELNDDWESAIGDAQGDTSDDWT